MTLLLFDIDGTLLNTHGSGLAALQDAAMEHFQIERDQVPPFDLAGATDLSVVRRLFADLGQVLDDAAAASYKALYLRQLAQRLQANRGKLLPGVQSLLDGLCNDQRFHLGLLTGNYREGAMLKLQAFDLHHYFVEGAFGCDAEDRNHLGPIAMKRMSQAMQRSYEPEQTIIIGDTPRDVACARACGAKCLAVATGAFSEAALADHTPWALRADLADTSEIIRALATAKSP
jgi:phosphoglycolate phosphatase-like HAD superfamily hydrolase